MMEDNTGREGMAIKLFLDVEPELWMDDLRRDKMSMNREWSSSVLPLKEAVAHWTFVPKYVV